MIFTDCGLLRSPYCKISYLLAEERWRHTDNSWIDGKFWQTFVSNVHKRFFYIFFPRFYVFNVFLIFIGMFITPMLRSAGVPSTKHKVLTVGYVLCFRQAAEHPDVPWRRTAVLATVQCSRVPSGRCEDAERECRTWRKSTKLTRQFPAHLHSKRPLSSPSSLKVTQ